MDDFHRCSIRLPGHDYGGEAVYFITLCVKDKLNLFGCIQGGVILLSPFGKIVQAEWLRTPRIRPNVELGNYMIMPNHFHGVLSFVGAHSRAPYQLDDMNDPGKAGQVEQSRNGQGILNSQVSSGTERAHGCAPLRAPRSLGALIAGFKATTTVQINMLRGTPRAPVWQRNYWEHVIRDEENWQRIADYIISNPLR